GFLRSSRRKYRARSVALQYRPGHARFADDLFRRWSPVRCNRCRQRCVCFFSFPIKRKLATAESADEAELWNDQSPTTEIQGIHAAGKWPALSDNGSRRVLAEQ